MVDENSENEKTGLFSLFGGKRSRRGRSAHVARHGAAESAESAASPSGDTPEPAAAATAQAQPAQAQPAQALAEAEVATPDNAQPVVAQAPAPQPSAPEVADAPETPQGEAHAADAVEHEVAEAVPTADEPAEPANGAVDSQPESAAQPAQVEAPAEVAATDPLANITPFSPFSAIEQNVEHAPAVPSVVEQSVALTFQAPVLPEPSPESYDDSEQPEADESGSSRRRTRHREGSRSRTTDAQRAGDAAGKAPVIDAPMKVKGSTRLEAKKQRRNASRDAGRHRQSVTEVEFQARREAVDRQMIVRSTDDRIQIGVLEDDILVEHYAAHSRDLSLIGNVYLGKVQNVLPSMEAAFVDIGRGRNAVLYSGEVDWEAAEVTDAKQRRIELALKPGDIVLVQVTKDPVGHKGARLTSQISLPGRYLVYVPGGGMNGISRKLPDSERARLKKILKETLPENVGVIVRTAAEGATKEQLEHDISRLQMQWEEIVRLRETAKAPALLHSEPNLLIKVIRDVFNEDITKLVVSGEDAEQTIDKYLHTVAPDLVDRVEHYAPAEHNGKDIFEQYRVNEQLAKASERKVFLPSGGSLVIDRTEAMTVIDVNTGKFVGSGGNLEETVTKNNLEAAEEIVRQLRLRDLGGIVVVDFIDMVLESNRDLVLRRLIECLGRDRTKHQVAEVTSLGLVQMTRKKIGIGLAETFTQLADGGHAAQEQKPQSHGKKSRQKKTQQQTKAQQPKLNDEVKSAVAAVAASTIAAASSNSGAAAGAAAVHAAESEPAKPATASIVPEAVTVQPEAKQPEPQPVAQPVADSQVLTLPEAKPAAKSEGASSPDTDRLLANVLASLPDGNAPGSRRRSRRASLPAGRAVDAASHDEGKN